MCIRNDSAEPFGVTAGAGNIVSNELPGCPDAFEAAAGDSTCGAGEGEFGNDELVVNYELVEESPGTGGDCRELIEGTSHPLAPTLGAHLGWLQPGVFCRYLIFLTDNRDDPSVSSTDTVAFDLGFVADNDPSLAPTGP